MKIFDYSKGRKGSQVGEAPYSSYKEGWLQREGLKVYRIKLSTDTPGWEWHSGASYNDRIDGELTGETIAILPEAYQREAICFCTGQTQHDKVWQWTVICTDEWKEWALEQGILTKTFSHKYKSREELNAIIQNNKNIY